MIRLFTKCVPPGAFTTTFDSGEFIVPATGGAPEGIDDALYPCDYYDHLCWTPVVWGLAVAQITYTPPATSKPGIWEVTVTAEPVALKTVPDPAPDPFYNGYIRVGNGSVLCCSGTLSPVFTNFVEGNDMIQISAAGDGSDAAAMPDLVFEMPLRIDGAFPCCSCRTTIQFINGPWDAGGVPEAFWSWKLRCTGVWVSDFPP